MNFDENYDILTTGDIMIENEKYKKRDIFISFGWKIILPNGILCILFTVILVNFWLFLTLIFGCFFNSRQIYLFRRAIFHHFGWTNL